ncbi:hypothetical protein [Nostoc sp. PCC 7524]|uniref:hypothetical protein n=1 Tax=Nostoc sp. (strain ATCC 29411 / PCC 7524) TaxID=28072 RepID=UPI0005A15A04|nr:hypothetical protein [Nostoc sp. PCC 7524]
MIFFTPDIISFCTDILQRIFILFTGSGDWGLGDEQGYFIRSDQDFVKSIGDHGLIRHYRRDCQNYCSVLAARKELALWNKDS